MPTRLRRGLRLAHRGVWYAVALTLVCMAVALGVASQLLPLAERHPQRIEAWLSQQAGRPVRFDAVQTQWTRRGPLLRLEGLRIGGDAGVRIGEAEVLVSMYAGLLPGRSFTELRLRGLALTLEQGDDGLWSIHGLPGQATGDDPLRNLEGLGELQIIGGQLNVNAPALDLAARLARIDLRLQVQERRVRAGARVWVRQDAVPLEVALDFDRRQGDGRAYLEVESAELAAWAPVLRYDGIAAASGTGRARAWAELQRHRVVSVAVDAQLREVDLRTVAAEGPQAQPVEFGDVHARLLWRMQADGGWRLDAPQLRVGPPSAQQRLDGLVMAAGPRLAVWAEQVDAAPLFALASLSRRLDPDLRSWLAQARPEARFADLRMEGAEQGALHLQGRLLGLGFAPVGDRPGLQGLQGDFVADAQGLALRLDPTARLRFDWPSGFGVAHDMSLDGQLLAWREGEGWRVGTASLQVRGEDFGVDLRGGLWLQADGSRPRIDLAAEVHEAPLTAAKGFWVRHKMPEAAVEWLDGALAGGRVVGGQAVISGDLDDWPFVDHDGRFEARARISGGQVRFHPDWPALEQMEAEAVFIGNGFSVQGKGAIAGVVVQRFGAGIGNYKDAVLEVDADSESDASRLLGLLRRSPLRRVHGETFAGLTVSGPARTRFDLVQPLHRDQADQRRLQGKVQLQSARLGDARWNLEFDDVTGELDYAHDGFASQTLAVSRNGRPGQLRLRAGEHVQDPTQAFEAELTADLTPDDLLVHAPQMAWLRPYLAGRSTWTVEVDVPEGAPAGTASLQLRSQLVGTALRLPEPLGKSAPQPLATTVQALLPLDRGQIQVAFGERLALRARSDAAGTGVRAVLGSGRVAAAPPISGLVVTGTTPALDVIEWIGLARGQGEGEMPLRQIDVQAERLLLLGGAFAQTRLQVRPTGSVLDVRVEGPALAGTARVPEAAGAQIEGRFSRVHWQAARGSGNGDAAPADAVDAAPVAETAAVAPSDATALDFDPSRIPPLALEVEDLRWGEASLGRAQLRTRPLGAGLHVERLQLRSQTQRIDIDGEWIGRGAAARTRMTASAVSQDMGGLAALLGLQGHVAGGHGRVEFDAGWPGSPAAFRLAALDGRLKLSAQDGQLLEVEPGAGRVLGLLSVAQLPRRMMLDFRDFFSKGFAFNQLDGLFHFADGTARSDAMVIDGPAAEIQIHGSADLRSQHFDQTIEVLPKSGNLLTVVGAVAGGPVGAAVGAAANAVLKRPLGEMGARTYRVTGPWKDPKVEVISREQSRVETPARAPLSGP